MKRYCHFLKLGDLESAYKIFSEGSRKNYPYESFARNCGSMGNFGVSNVLTNQKDELTADVQVTVKPQGAGQENNYIFHMIKEKGKWKIESCETVKKDAVKDSAKDSEQTR